MEADAATRYRSRILREMNANRENPFNSPPSSTGSHGTVSPTMSSVFSDPEGESTRKLNEDIARITAPRINLDAAHRKWPEFYSAPKATRNKPIFHDNTDTRPMSSESKENKPGHAVRFSADDSTHDIWRGSTRPRSEMQPRVDDGSDMSSLLGTPPKRFSAKNNHNPSPLAKVHSRVPSTDYDKQRHPSLSEAVDRLRMNSNSPRHINQQRDSDRHHSSPNMSSAKSSLTAVPPSPVSMDSPGHNASHVRSFFMPDVSHLGDFVTGTLRFSGSMKNGVPVFVKHGKVHDSQDRRSSANHASVEGLEVPEDEERIFVSMDMIRDEIINLQEHYDKVQEYASNLQNQVDDLERELKSRPAAGGREASDRVTEQLLEQKKRLEVEITTLHSRLEQSSRRVNMNELENESLTQQRDRAVRKLQEACEDINKLTRKLSQKGKALETSQKQLESTEQMRQDNDTLRRDIRSLENGRESLEHENASLREENDKLQSGQQELQEEIHSLRSDNDTLRRQHSSLLSENRSLRSSNQTLMTENEDLRENLDGVQNELDSARELVESLQQEVEEITQEKATLRQDNESLVKHNDQYFSENKILRRENAGFERTLNDLHDQNEKFREDAEIWRRQLEDQCGPVPTVKVPVASTPKDEEFTARLDEETEENMTSAFFLPDITVDTNASGAAENTETKEITEPQAFQHQNTKLSTIADVTEPTEKSVRASKSKKQAVLQRSSSNKMSKSNTSKVAFSNPETSDRSNKNASNMPNQKSKRRSTSQQSILKRTSFPSFNPFDDNEDTTGAFSADNTTQDHSVALTVTNGTKSRKETKSEEQSHRTADITNQSNKTKETTGPVLSKDARRVLDGLCGHNCRNCTVCSRISSHRSIISTSELSTGKKRVVIPRPIPVTDRNLGEDCTMRPLSHPGHALAMVIKGLEDEEQHLKLEHSRLQTKYNASDSALGRREARRMEENLAALAKQISAKKDQIYMLHDVLEGQKAAGQAMTEEEIEMTVLNITGLTVRDVTGGSETWEGIMT